MSEEEVPRTITEREEQMILGTMNGIQLFEAATEEQAKEIKRDLFGTDDDLVLIEIFKDLLNKIKPSEREIVWNTLVARLGLQDLDMTMEQALDVVKSKLIHDSIPCLHWSSQPLPRVVHMDDGTAYTITEMMPERGEVLPVMYPTEVTTVYPDPDNHRPIPTCHTINSSDHQ